MAYDLENDQLVTTSNAKATLAYANTSRNAYKIQLVKYQQSERQAASIQKLHDMCGKYEISAPYAVVHRLECPTVKPIHHSMVYTVACCNG